MSDQTADLGYPFNTTFGRSTLSSRPQSASYYARHQSNDLGRSVQLHKDLHKGEFAQATLAKVFDDPHMRPKVMAPTPVNKPDLSLTTSDIEGAKSRPKDVPARPRDTNPNSPLYILATPSAEPAAPPSPPARRNNLDVSDIDRARPRPQSASGRNFSLNSRDIEGAYPSWKTEQKAALAGTVAAVSGVGPDHTSSRGGSGGRGGMSKQPEQQQHASRMSSAARGALVDSVVSAATAAAHTQMQHDEDVYAAREANGDGSWGSRPSSGTQRQQSPELSAADMMVAAAATAIDNSSSSSSAGGGKPHITDALGNPIGRADKRNTPDRHSDAVWQADTKAYNAAVASQVVADMAPSKATVQQLWSECRKFDREGCGKLTPVEFATALSRSGMHLPPARMAALVTGMADVAGLLPYRDLSKVLLRKTWGVQPAATTLPPKPAARPASAVPWMGSVYGQPPATAKGGSSSGADGSSRKSRPVSAPASRQHVAAPAAVASAVLGEVRSSVTATAVAQPPERLRWADEHDGQDGHAHGGHDPRQAALPPYQADVVDYAVGEYQADMRGASAAMPQQQQDSLQSPVYQRIDSNSQREHQRPQSASASSRPPPPQQQEPPAQDRPHRRLPSSIEELTGIKVGEAAQYFPYKAHGYWFGGNDGEGTLDADRLAWKACNDCSRSSKIRQPSLGDGRPLDSTGPWAATGQTQVASRIPDTPTTSSALKSGTLAASELASRVAASAAKHAAPWHQRQKAAAAVGEPLIAAMGSGASVGSTLKPAGAAAMVMAAGVQSRPSSASARMTSERQAGGDFGLGSPLAPPSGNWSRGTGAVRLQRQQMRDDIAAVRCLY